MPKVAIAGINFGQYLAIDGWVHLPPLILGEHSLTLGGSSRTDEVGRKERFSCKTVPVTPAVADAIEALLERSDSLAFDEAAGSVGAFVGYSQRGVGPLDWSVITGGTQIDDGTVSLIAPKYGNELFVDDGDHVLHTSDLLTGAWTLMGWRSQGVAEHWVKTSDGGAWKNGVAAASPGDVSVSGGVLTFAAGSGPAAFDDWQLIAAVIPTAWVAPLYAEHQARAITLPRLRVTGDLVPGGLLTMRAELKSRKPMVTAAGLREVVEFILEEE